MDWIKENVGENIRRRIRRGFDNHVRHVASMIIRELALKSRTKILNMKKERRRRNGATTALNYPLGHFPQLGEISLPVFVPYVAGCR
jgi:hypothetical protein